MGIALSVLVAGMVSGPSTADVRLTISASKELVVQGSATEIRLGDFYGEVYDWKALKFEVLQQSTNLIELNYSVSSSPQVSCLGFPSGTGSQVRNCAGSIPRNPRTVIAGGVPTESRSQANLSLVSATSKESQIGIRAWLDLDGDDEISAYEPSSNVAEVHFISIESFNGFLDFHVDPPLLNNTSTTAWVSDGTGFTQVGQNALDAIDIAKLVVVSDVCTWFCSSSETGARFSASPQLDAYRFDIGGLGGVPSTYEFKLVYKQTGKDPFVLATKKFDYSARLVGGISTNVSGKSLSDFAGPGGPSVDGPERWRQLPTSQTSFSYSATILAADGKPLRNFPVVIRVDASGTKDNGDIEINGLSSGVANMDQIWIDSTTNSEGKVDFGISNPSPRHWDNVLVEVRAEGWRGWERGSSGRSERIVWLGQLPSTPELVALSPSAKGLLTVRIRVPIETSGINPMPAGQAPTVLIGTSRPLATSHRILKLTRSECSKSASGQVPKCWAYADVGVKISQNRGILGVAKLTVKTTQSGKWHTATMDLYWRGSDGLISTKPLK